MNDVIPSEDKSGGDPPSEKPPVELESAPRVERAIQKLVDQKPEAIMEMLAVTGSGMFNPLHNKMEGEHITKILDHAIKHDQQEFELANTKEVNAAEEKKRTQLYIFAAFAIIVALLVLILFLFKTQPQLLLPLMSGITGLAAGFVAGLGAGKSQSK